MTEDLELKSWQAEWREGTGPLPEIHRKLKRQNFFFALSNIVAAVAFFAALALTVVVVRHEPSPERIAWAVGIWILSFACAGYRLWTQRGTWRPATQSTRAFAELLHKRAIAHSQSARMGFYAIPAWITFCAGIVAFRWSVFGPDIKAHPVDYLLALGVILLVVGLAFLYLAWFRRRKLRAAEEAWRLLEEIAE